MILLSFLFGCSEYDIQDMDANPPSGEESKSDTLESVATQDEVCDGLDNDNNGIIDDGFLDSDFDGIADCVDIEECDGLDNDGDGLIDEDMPDSDFDGIVDCFDVEMCDSLDNDGDGLIDEEMPDTDGDGIVDCIDVELCDGLDNDGDGLIDEDMPDTDGDGILDCFDVEECDDIDNNGNGLVDEGFDLNGNDIPDCFEFDDCDGIDSDGDGLIDEDADSNDDGIGDCFQIATIFTYGFYMNGSSICGNSTVLDREMQEIDYVLSGLGYSAAFFIDDRSESIDYSQLSHFSSIIYHNGGWMDHGSLSVMQALDTAATMGKGLIFLGDDSAFHASGSQSQHGANTFFNLMGFASYSSNGSAGTVNVVNSTHPIMNGAMGTVGSFYYIADIDDATAAGNSTVLMQRGNSPAVIATEDGNSRRVTINMRLNNSSDCPSGATSVPAEMEILFHNTLLWVEWN